MIPLSVGSLIRLLPWPKASEGKLTFGAQSPGRRLTEICGFEYSLLSVVNLGKSRKILQFVLERERQFALLYSAGAGYRRRSCGQVPIAGAEPGQRRRDTPDIFSIH